jgi:hypothetical protein
MQGAQYGSNTRFNFEKFKKKPPAEAVVEESL